MGGFVTATSYRKIVDATIKLLGCNCLKDRGVRIKIKSVTHGRAYVKKRKIIMPDWLNNFDEQYRMYYILHELTHCLAGLPHDETFKNVEDFILKAWGLRIERKKVYPKKLYYNDRRIFNIPR